MCVFLLLRCSSHAAKTTSAPSTDGDKAAMMSDEGPLLVYKCRCNGGVLEDNRDRIEPRAWWTNLRLRLHVVEKRDKEREGGKRIFAQPAFWLDCSRKGEGSRMKNNRREKKKKNLVYCFDISLGHHPDTRPGITSSKRRAVAVLQRQHTASTASASRPSFKYSSIHKLYQHHFALS